MVFPFTCLIFVTSPESRDMPKTPASEPPSSHDRPLSRPSMDELNYALMALQIRKVRAESQKIELEKANLKMDILMKEERLDQQYGKDQWRKRLTPEPVEVAMTVCHSHCKGPCRDTLSCSSRQCDSTTCNQSQNRQDSFLPLPHVQIHRAPATRGPKKRISPVSFPCERCNHNLNQFGRNGEGEQDCSEEGEKGATKSEQKKTNAVTPVPRQRLKHQYKPNAFAESLESHIASFYNSQRNAESHNLCEAKENETSGKINETAEGTGRGGKTTDRGRKGWSFGFLGRKLKE